MSTTRIRYTIISVFKLPDSQTGFVRVLGMFNDPGTASRQADIWDRRVKKSVDGTAWEGRIHLEVRPVMPSDAATFVRAFTDITNLELKR